jgi:hypothetical protein
MWKTLSSAILMFAMANAAHAVRNGGGDGGGSSGGSSSGSSGGSSSGSSGGVTAAPELDPSSMITGLTLLAGALVVVRGRREKL